MHDTTAVTRPNVKIYTPADNPRFPKLHRRFPTVAYLRRHARRKLPHFAFEYCDGGAGADGGTPLGGVEVLRATRPGILDVVLSTTLAFGGVNACLAFGKAERCA